MLNDEATAILYEWNKGRQWGDKQTTCDEVCRRESYCYTTSTEETQYAKCKQTKPNLKAGALFDIVLNILTDPWIIKSEK